MIFVLFVVLPAYYTSMSNLRSQTVYRASAAACIGLAVFCVAALLLWRADSGEANHVDYRALLLESEPLGALDPAMVVRIETFCSDCHALPRPENFDRDRWHFEVKKGYEFYARSGRQDLNPPPVALTYAYYRERAPQELTFPQPAEASIPLPVGFEVENLHMQTGTLPEIATLRWADLGLGGHRSLIACDMRYGQVVAIDPRPERDHPLVLAQLRHPCRAEPCDLDGDGAKDLVVADLGGYYAADHNRGQVVLLRRRPDSTEFASVVLASGLGRVSDVRPADFDADGDLDLVVANFGWQETGNIFLLRNEGAGEEPQFSVETIDIRPGTIHVPVHDFTGDGRPDFAALVSQEFETVEIFASAPRGQFRRTHIYAAPDLSFGSSGIELVDLDQDEDMDVLYTNGDSWDNNYASPQHGVQWLENQGELRFEYHRLTDMLGAYRALAGDLDGDGDQDVVATAWLPNDVQPRTISKASHASLIVLQQTEPGVFVRHTIERGLPHYAALELGDFDGDEDLDFVVGSGPQVATAREGAPFLSIRWNQLHP